MISQEHATTAVSILTGLVGKNKSTRELSNAKQTPSLYIYEIFNGLRGNLRDETKMIAAFGRLVGRASQSAVSEVFTPTFRIRSLVAVRLASSAMEWRPLFSNLQLDLMVRPVLTSFGPVLAGGSPGKPSHSHSCSMASNNSMFRARGHRPPPAARAV